MEDDIIVAIDFGTRRTAFSYRFGGSGDDIDRREITLGEKRT